KGHCEGAPRPSWDLLESFCFIDPETRQARAYQHDQSMTDEELESAIAFLHEMMAAQAVGSAHLVEMKAEPAALPAPGGQSPEKLSSGKPCPDLLHTAKDLGKANAMCEQVRDLPGACQIPKPEQAALRVESALSAASRLGGPLSYVP